MNTNRSARRLNDLMFVTAAAAALSLASASVEAGSIEFEGYRSGAGSPPVGGGIGSEATILPVEPWFGTTAYRYLDGWNHAPRVPGDQYDGIWTAGGHAGTGTDIDGTWASLDESQPDSYAFDFEGYETISRVFDNDPASPTYGHETRTYSGANTAWTLWDLRNPAAPVELGTGTLTDLIMDIFYDPLNAGADPHIEGTAVAIADAGSAFYDDLIGQFGSPDLDFTFICEDPPIEAINPAAPAADQWAIYGARYIVSAAAPVPEPATLGLFAAGLAGIGMRRRPRRAG